MLGYFYLCVTFSGLRKSYGLNFFFFRPELSVNIARELSFEWAQQKTSFGDLKWASLVLNSLCITPGPHYNANMSISIAWSTLATQTSTLSMRIRGLCASEDGLDISVSINTRISRPCCTYAYAYGMTVLTGS